MIGAISDGIWTLGGTRLRDRSSFNREVLTEDDSVEEEESSAQNLLERVMPGRQNAAYVLTCHFQRTLTLLTATAWPCTPPPKKWPPLQHPLYQKLKGLIL